MNLKGFITKTVVAVLTLFMVGTVAMPMVSLAEANEGAAAAETTKSEGSQWKPFAAALAIIGTAMATAIAQMKIGGAGAGAIAERPETAAMFIVLVAIPETIVILGFVVAAMLIMF